MIHDIMHGIQHETALYPCKHCSHAAFSIPDIGKANFWFKISPPDGDNQKSAEFCNSSGVDISTESKLFPLIS